MNPFDIKSVVTTPLSDLKQRVALAEKRAVTRGRLARGGVREIGWFVAAELLIILITFLQIVEWLPGLSRVNG